MRLVLSAAVVLVLTGTLLGGQSASLADVNSILDEIKLVPPARRTAAGEDRLLQAANLPAFSAKVLDAYRTDDYRSIGELQKRHKATPMKFAKERPVRAAVLDAIEALQKSDRSKLRETLKGPIDVKQKAAFLREQDAPGVILFELEQVLNDMAQVAEHDLDQEKSKRWRANFDHTMARLKARIVYIYEYSYMLGQIRSDNLPNLEKGATGWKLVSRPKIQVPEGKAKQYAKDLSRAWANIQKDYPDTSWAVIAKRDSMVELGLEWRTNKE